MEPLTPAEMAVMRSVQVLEHTIQHLLRERDALVAQLPARPVQRMGRQLDGVEIKRSRRTPAKPKEER